MLAFDNPLSKAAVNFAVQDPCQNALLIEVFEMRQIGAIVCFYQL